MTRLTVGLCRKILSRAICVIIVIIVVVVIIIFVNWSSSSSNDLVDKVKVTRCYHPEEIGWNCKTHQQEYKYFQKYDGLQKYNEYEHEALYKLQSCGLIIYFRRGPAASVIGWVGGSLFVSNSRCKVYFQCDRVKVRNNTN